MGCRYLDLIRGVIRYHMKGIMAAFGITALLIIFAGLTVPVVFGGEDYSAPVESIPKIPMEYVGEYSLTPLSKLSLLTVHDDCTVAFPQDNTGATKYVLTALSQNSYMLSKNNLIVKLTFYEGMVVLEKEGESAASLYKVEITT